MHRSGTSFFTNYVSNWGIIPFGELMEPDSGNINGYFENTAIVEFHNSILKRNNLGYFFQETNPKINLIPSDYDFAGKILKQNSDENKFNSFKDPRTSLFLNLWKEVLKEQSTFYILLIRHPFLVKDSLIRRKTDDILLHEPKLALNTWYVYNKRIFDFYKDNKKSAIIISVEDFIRNSAIHKRIIGEKAEVSLETRDYKSIFKKNEFRRHINSFIEILRELNRPIFLLKVLRLWYNMKRISRKEIKN